MEELLRHPRAFRVLLALAKEEEPMNMRQFCEASRYARHYALPLREELERLGYIVVEEGRGHGAFGVLEIRLSPFGRRVASALQVAEQLVEEHRRRHPLEDEAAD